MPARSHGLSNTPDYKLWQQIKIRCYDPNAVQYHRYGGRGIRMCERWRTSFENFITDMGARPSLDHSIERLDNDGDYTRENCTWLLKRDQSRNNSRTRLLAYEGGLYTVTELATRFDLDRGTLDMRLRAGWSIERALTEPVMERSVTFNGETHSVSEWSRRTGISYSGIRRRLDEGWPVELALTTPPDKVRDRYGRYTEKPPVPTHSSTP